MKITKFCKTDLVDYASYSTLRAIASLIDGQKNASRKVLYTVLQKNIKNEIKVSQLSSKMAEFTEYLHGSADGSITNLAQNFVGSNNLNLLEPEGNFGTRFAPDPSASRYIMTYGSKTLFELFKNEDDNVLIKQEFEGQNIEYRFYVPTLPIILINGSEGIATGFAQKILPRNIEDIKKYIHCYLNNEKTPELLPYYKGFNGIIEKGEENNQYYIKGVFERISIIKLRITELPIGYNLKSYTKILDDLEDKKIIKNYIDLSEDDKFLFEVQMDSKSLKNSDKWILEKLKLVKKVTENFTVIDENNRVKSYTTPEEVINHYIEIKLLYMNKRKEHLLNKIKDDIDINMSKYTFIDNILKNNITINNKSKNEIIEQIIKLDNYRIIKIDDSYDYLLRMPLWNLTPEKVQELYNKMKELKTEYDRINNKNETSLWLEEVSTFYE